MKKVLLFFLVFAFLIPAATFARHKDDHKEDENNRPTVTAPTAVPTTPGPTTPPKPQPTSRPPIQSVPLGTDLLIDESTSIISRDDPTPIPQVFKKIPRDVDKNKENDKYIYPVIVAIIAGALLYEYHKYNKKQNSLKKKKKKS